MFLRKLTVMVVPILLCGVLCILFPLLNGLGFWSNVIKGAALGVALALLLPLSGASRRKEPFAGLLWIPAVLLILTVGYQYLHSMGMINLPVLNMLATTNGQVVLTECVFAGYMITQSLRTRS
ncbi:MAG: hypothetical protein IJ507_10430 [Clostridia bacterium]|nr:hypothetical protein [Clostridia bacterium]